MKILITGASGGFGKLTVKTLLDSGHQVVASMRNVTTKNQAVAKEITDWGGHVIEIDVTQEDSVNKGVATAVELMNGIDVLINNAGVGSLGMQEHFTPEDYQKLFDVNVFGVQRMNRAVIPHLRKQNAGLILYISSLLGRMTMPFYGTYNATKWALEAMAENYRIELSNFGIENCIVEPGGYPTTFMENLMMPSDNSRNASYGDFMNLPQQVLSNFEKALNSNPLQNPQQVADMILSLVQKPKGQKPFRTVVDAMGMGTAIEQYNQTLEQIMKGIFTNFGMEGMLSLNK